MKLKMNNMSQFLFVPQMQATSSASDDHIDNNDGTLCAMASSYDDELMQFMLLNSEFAENDFILMSGAVEESYIDQKADDVNSYSQFDTFSGSPELSWHIDDEVQVSENARKGQRKNVDYSGSVMKTKRDRSKTIVSERKRRVRMKEKLYELRSLVPNITKMDKASIIADAVVYVEDLKSQAKKLVEEIDMFKSSSSDYRMLETSNKNVTEAVTSRKSTTSVCGKITKVDVHELGDALFHVKVKGGINDGVSSSLYSAIETLSCFHLESSNFTVVLKEFELVMTFKVGGFGEEINASKMKLWLMGALIEQGFEIDKKLLS